MILACLVMAHALPMQTGMVFMTEPRLLVKPKPVILEKNVWVGEDAMICKGVTSWREQHHRCKISCYKGCAI